LIWQRIDYWSDRYTNRSARISALSKEKFKQRE
jgi:hypothetical protein